MIKNSKTNMDDTIEIYRGVEIFETMSLDPFGEMPKHVFKAKVNNKRIRTSNKYRHKALTNIKNKIDHVK